MTTRQRCMKRRMKIFLLVGILVVSFSILFGGLTAFFQQSQPVETVSSQTWPGGGGDQLVYGVGEDGLTPVPLKVTVLNGYGALDVYIQDQHTQVVLVPFHFHSGVTVTLAITAPPGDWDVSITPTGTIPASSTIAFGKSDAWWYGKALTTPGATLELDQSINVTYEIGTIIEIVTDNLAIDASITRTESHVYSVPSLDFDITEIHISMICTAEPDDSKFCDQVALERGIFLRYLNGETGTYENLGNAKTNGAIALFCGQVSYHEKGGAGLWGLRAVCDFRGDTGVTVRLRGTTTGMDTLNGRDELHVILQDDLTGLASMNVIVVGHVIAD